MPISFLAPAFALGLAAVAIPVWMHLTRSPRDRAVEFPSLMFLERIPHPTTKRRRLRHRALLAARILALLLLVAAFARPHLGGDDGAGAGDAGPREVVVAVDRSYSMAYGDRWSRAREAALERIRTLGPDDRATLVLFDEGAGAPIRSTTDRARLQAALDEARPGSRATRYAPALKLSGSVVGSSRRPRREIVVVSDFQASGWSRDAGVRLPPGVRFEPVVIGEGNAENTRVASLELERERRGSGSAGASERIRVTARVERTGGEGDRRVAAVLEVGGREAARTESMVPPGGTAELSFPPFVLAEAYTRGTVRLDPDRLPVDDAFHFVASPVRSRPVLILEGAGARDEGSLYLRRALEISRDPPFEADVRASSRIAPGELEGRAAVVLNGISWPRGASGERLRAFVEAGGGVLAVLGGAGDLRGSGAPIEAGPPADADDGRARRLGDLAYDHPIFTVFRGPRSGDFTGARFYRTRPLRVDSTVRVLARFDDGSPALAEARVGSGRVLAWASTLDTFWNDLALQPVFLPFVHRVALHLGGRSTSPPWRTVGDVVDLAESDGESRPRHGEPGHDHADCVARTPSGEEVPVPAREGGQLVELEERGFYEFRDAREDGPAGPVRTVAANVDAAESRLEPLDVEELAAAIAPRPGEAAESGGEAEGVRAVGGEGGEVGPEEERSRGPWRWLLAAAFVLLAVETAWSNRVEGDGS